MLIQKDTGHETVIQKNLIANTVLQDCEGFWRFRSVEMSRFVVQTLETNLFISSLNLWKNLNEGCQNPLLDSKNKVIVPRKKRKVIVEIHREATEAIPLLIKETKGCRVRRMKISRTSALSLLKETLKKIRVQLYLLLGNQPAYSFILRREIGCA